MPRASIVVSAYNTLKTLPETVSSLLAQDFDGFEVLVVDDGSTDGTADWVLAHPDPRLRLVRQLNRGLAGARNGGIAEALGEYIGFCDGDDLWEPEKLSEHVAFLEANPAVGLTYSGSSLIDEVGAPLGLSQSPKAGRVTARDVLLRNPVGNGSTPVLRRACLDDIQFRPKGETRSQWFDESFRQSEDIECWLRIALTTRWVISGTDAPLTRYRIVSSGLSANVLRQFETWLRVAERVQQVAPDFARLHLPAAKAYQLRYLARRAVTLGAGRTALALMLRSNVASLHPLWHEPAKTLTTFAAACVVSLGRGGLIQKVLKGRTA